MNDLKNLLKNGPVCLDGAVGTVLADRTGQRSLSESLLLTEAGRRVVRDLHAEYAEGGAQALTTNSFAANRITLEREGVAADVAYLNETAVALAKEAGKGKYLIAGSVGPLNLGLQRQDFSPDSLAEIYSEQIDALVRAGVDFLKLETFTDPVEATAALMAVGKHHLPFILQLRGWRRGMAQNFSIWTPVLHLAEEMEAVTVGCNCAPPQDIAYSLHVLRNMTALPLAAQPNSGTPRIERGTVTWQEPAEGLNAWIQRYLEMGVRIIGGCCGTTPTHMREAARIVREFIPPIQSAMITELSAPVPERTAPKKVENPLGHMLESNRLLVSVEIRAGSGRGLREVLDSCARLPLDRIDLFDIPDNPGAGVARDSAMVSVALQDRCGVPAIPHRATTHTNAIQMQSGLLAAWDLGIRGILAVTGDVPQAGDHSGIASRVSDVKSSVGLLRMVGSLNEGKLISGKTISEPCDFVAGCAFNPNGPQGPQVNWLRKKVESGARFVFTQPVFDSESLERIEQAAEQFDGIRFFAGILPLASARQARSLADGRIPGIQVPEEIVRDLERFPRPEDQKLRAEELAVELAGKAAAALKGLYLIPPFSADGMEIITRVILSAR